MWWILSSFFLAKKYREKINIEEIKRPKVGLMDKEKELNNKNIVYPSWKFEIILNFLYEHSYIVNHQHR